MWKYGAGGKISGSPVVVGDLVFYSNLSRRSSGAVGAVTGKPVWATGRGAFSPVISDGRRLYFNVSADDWTRHHAVEEHFDIGHGQAD